MNFIHLTYLVGIAILGTTVLFFLVKAARRSQCIEFLPSLSWLLLAVIPLGIQFPYFSPQYVPIQCAAVLIFGFAIVTADIYSLFRQDSRKDLSEIKKSRYATFQPQTEKIIIAGVLLAILGGQIMHLWLMPKIPLLEKLKGDDKVQGLSSRFQDFESRWNTITMTKILEEFSDHSIEKNGEILTERVNTGQAQSAAWHESQKKFEVEHAKIISEIPHELREILTNCTKLLSEDWSAYIGAIASLKNRFDTSALTKISKAEKDLIRDLDNKGRRDVGYCIRDYDSKHLSLLRESSSKNLAISSVLIYFVQSMLLVTPAFAFYLMRRRYFAISLFVIVFSLIYSRATLAKGPLYVMILLYGTIGWQSLSGKLRRNIVKVSVPFALAIFAVMVHFYATHSFSIFKFRAPLLYQQKILARSAIDNIPTQLTFTLTDHYRSMAFFFSDPLFDKAEQEKAIPLKDYEGYFNFLAYRAFLAPTEVAHRWYTYYPDVNKGFIGWYGITPGSRRESNFRQPANTVARFSYVKMYPEIYLDSAYSYASADADAYSRWGFVGVFAVAMVTFGLRVLSSILPQYNPLERYLYWSSIVVLAISLPAASIQAILVAQGLAVLLFARLGLTGIQYLSGKHSSDMRMPPTQSVATGDQKQLPPV